MFRLFGFLSNFDIITPAVGMIEDFLNDPSIFQDNSWTFFVPYGQSLNRGWNRRQIEALLKRYGIKTWHHQITNGEYFFSVKLDQVEWAQYQLSKHGVPLNEQYIGGRHSQVGSSEGQSWLFPDGFFGGQID